MVKFSLSGGKKRFAVLAVCAACVAAVVLSLFSGCDFLRNIFGQNGDGSQPGGNEPPAEEDSGAQTVKGEPERFTKEEEKLVNFATWGGTHAFHAANGYSNGGMFDCVWSSGNAAIYDGRMNLSVTTDGNKFYGAEYRSNAKYPYGFYSVNMKAAKCSGVVSSFFTYTNWPWDEIDIEFLGNDTTKVQFNYYTNGVGGHEYVYKLGFDASEEFHEYAFDWRQDCIVWYVDGKPVYKATENIPSHAGQIMMNIWNGKGVDDWIGAFDKSKVPVAAQYKWIGYKAA